MSCSVVLECSDFLAQSVISKSKAYLIDTFKLATSLALLCFSINTLISKQMLQNERSQCPML